MLEILYSRERKNQDKELLKRIGRDVDSGKRITLLVPEQQVYSAEVMLSYNGIMSPELEVVGFRRLCESIFRRFGGLSYNNITDGARLILMWRVISELSPMLKQYKDIMLDDIDMIKSLNASVRELSLYALSPAMLEESAKKLENENPKLSDKLYDLSLILAASSALLKNNYNDPAEDTKRAYDLLLENDYFSNRTVYVSGFVSFTVYEKKIIDSIVRSAENTVALIGFDIGEKRDIFDMLKKTRDVFLNSAKEAGVKTLSSQIDGETSAQAIDISYLAENIWDFEAEKYNGKCENICIASADNPEEESRFVASDIARLIREKGARYRDFAIIVRSLDDYSGIVDRELAACGVPGFISSRSDIKKKSAIKAILLALKIRSGSWRTDDVISYIKCGFTGLSNDECDKIERYALLWKISGKRWFDEHLWAMHPRGFGNEITDADREVLEELNSCRERLTSPLVRFFEIFEKKPTLKEVSYSLYKFLCEIGLREKLEIRAATLRDGSRVAEADETVQIWNCLVDSLDSLVTVAGEARVDARSYMKLLSTSLEMSDIGKIPSGIDEVLIGEAHNLRMSEVKYVYVMGLNEGVFPKKAKEDSILGDRDRRDLKKIGIELSPESRESSRDEMFYFYLAISTAREKLTLTYNKKNNFSAFISSVRALFDKIESVDASALDPEFFVWGDLSALEYCVRIGDIAPEASQRLGEYLEDRGRIGYFNKKDLVSGDYSYTGDLTLFEKNMSLSQSRLESYVLCPFGYYCKYVLRIAEEASAEATSANIGTFVHSFLENFVKRYVKEGILYDDTESRQRIFEEIFSDGVRSLGDFSKDAKTAALIERIKNNVSIAVDNLAKEFSESKFVPSFFELKIGKEGISPVVLPTSDDGSVALDGIIDRVDLCEIDGRIYLRVVDYKTGSKTFTKEDVYHGLNTQMLLYLQTVCKTDDKNFLENIGATDGEAPMPAAIIYLSTKLPSPADIQPGTEREKIEKKIENQKGTLKRAGLVTDDREVMSAMDPGLAGKYSPVKIKKDGTYAYNTERFVESSFDNLFNRVNRKIISVANDMKSGKACAEPLKTDTRDACEYCAFSSVCRRKSYCEEHSTVLHSVNDDENNYGGND